MASDEKGKIVFTTKGPAIAFVKVLDYQQPVFVTYSPTRTGKYVEWKYEMPPDIGLPRENKLTGANDLHLYSENEQVCGTEFTLTTTHESRKTTMENILILAFREGGLAHFQLVSQTGTILKENDQLVIKAKDDFQQNFLDKISDNALKKRKVAYDPKFNSSNTVERELKRPRRLEDGIEPDVDMRDVDRPVNGAGFEWTDVERKLSFVSLVADYVKDGDDYIKSTTALTMLLLLQLQD